MLVYGRIMLQSVFLFFQLSFLHCHFIHHVNCFTVPCHFFLLSRHLQHITIVRMYIKYIISFQDYWKTCPLLCFPYDMAFPFVFVMIRVRLDVWGSNNGKHVLLVLFCSCIPSVVVMKRSKHRRLNTDTYKQFLSLTIYNYGSDSRGQLTYISFLFTRI